MKLKNGVLGGLLLASLYGCAGQHSDVALQQA